MQGRYRVAPETQSRPERLRSASVLAALCAALWLERSLATMSVASCAALTASCFGMTSIESANLGDGSGGAIRGRGVVMVRVRGV